MCCALDWLRIRRWSQRSQGRICWFMVRESGSESNGQKKSCAFFHEKEEVFFLLGLKRQKLEIRRNLEFFHLSFELFHPWVFGEQSKKRKKADISTRTNSLTCTLVTWIFMGVPKLGVDTRVEMARATRWACPAFAPWARPPTTWSKNTLFHKTF